MGTATACREQWYWAQGMRQLVSLVTILGIFDILSGAQCGTKNFPPGPLGSGYRVVSTSEFQDGTGIVAHLKLIEGSDAYGPDVEELRFTARYEEEGRIHVHITDAKVDRWEVPMSLLPRPEVVGHDLKKENSIESPTGRNTKEYEVTGMSSTHPLLLKYTIEPFSFSITRRSNNEVLFNTLPKVESEFQFNSLVFKDQYLEISTRLPTNASLYGFGEVTRPEGMLLTPGKRITLYDTDIASYFVDIPLYSSYPLYIDLQKGGIANGVLFLNSNGMDIIYEKEYLTYKAIGGILDFYFFPGPSPLAVIDQYTQLVGRPVAMPYWSLGFHQARFGYKTVEELEIVHHKFAAANLPLESIWADIDHMDNFKVFTLDPETYPEKKVRALVDRLHSNDQKFVMILDPGIKIDESYKSYVRGRELDVFLKNGTGEGRYIAQVWPGAANIPDFFHPNAQKWWTQEIADFHELIPFDGLWLDMNEPANFCTGPNCYYVPGVQCPDIIWKCCMVCDNNETRLTKWDNPPYTIDAFGMERELNVKTVAMSAQHYNGVRQYDSHNVYGMSEAMATYKALEEVTKKRPFVLSRSGFVGTGAYAAHWTGDNGALWSELRSSIPTILSSGMFGVPMVGADICGFNMHTTEELCRRWVQLGAFYPFARSHNDNMAKDQEFYLWDSVAESASKYFRWRYRLLPFLYTLTYEAHTTGAPMLRALFLEFPHDEGTWDINDQFLLGRSMLVSPALYENATSVKAYFPKGFWYNLFNPADAIWAGEEGVWKELPTPADAINVHIRDGSIIPMQEFAMTTTQAQKTPFTLLVAFAPEALPLLSCLTPTSSSSMSCSANADQAITSESASGHVYIDDDEQVEMSLTSGCASHIEFEATRVGDRYTLRSSVHVPHCVARRGLSLHNVTVLGMHAAPHIVHVNGEPAPMNMEIISTAGSGMVQFVGFRLPLAKDFEVVWTSSTSHICSDPDASPRIVE